MNVQIYYNPQNQTNFHSEDRLVNLVKRQRALCWSISLLDMICRFGIRLLVRDRLEIARKMAALERRFLRGEMCRVRVGKKYIKDTPMLTHDQQAKTASGLRKYSNSNEIQFTPKLRSVRLRILLLYLTYKILNSEIE